MKARRAATSCLRSLDSSNITIKVHRGEKNDEGIKEAEEDISMQEDCFGLLNVISASRIVKYCDI